jgi:uncharacterized membrane protein YdfJ with MMPL/SSD domain
VILYDVLALVLSRTREAVDRGMSTENAVAHGIKSTAGVITSAAAIVSDATLVRAVLLPATMKLLGARNRYLPKRLACLPKFEHEPEVMPAAA